MRGSHSYGEVGYVLGSVRAWRSETTLIVEVGTFLALSPRLIFSLRRRLNWLQALRLYATMRQRGVKPSQKSLTALASAMSRTISNVAMDAPSSPCPWSHALSLASYVGLADLKLDPSWHGTSFLLIFQFETI